MSKSAEAPTQDAAAGAPDAKRKGRGRLLLLLALPVVLIVVAAIGWFSGVLPSLLGLRHPATPGASVPPADMAASAPHSPVFMELPLIVANLNATGRRPVFVKLTAKLEIGKAEDQMAITASMPRVLDLFQTYLRETRPEELQGAAGTWRLRQELVARANIAVAPARVLDVLFTEMLVQ